MNKIVICITRAVSDTFLKSVEYSQPRSEGLVKETNLYFQILCKI